MEDEEMLKLIKGRKRIGLEDCEFWNDMNLLQKKLLSAHTMLDEIRAILLDNKTEQHEKLNEIKEQLDFDFYSQYLFYSNRYILGEFDDYYTLYKKIWQKDSSSSVSNIGKSL